MLCGANDCFLMLCESSGCHSPLHCSSSSPSVESSRYPFPLSALCAVPTATAHVPAVLHTLGAQAGFEHPFLQPSCLLQLWPSVLPAPFMHLFSRAIQLPTERRCWTETPDTLTCLVPMLPGQCGTMCHQPLPANGWAMSRSSCKLKYSSSHVYDLRGLWEGPLLASWHTCFSPRVEESLPDSESLGVPQALVWGSS